MRVEMGNRNELVITPECPMEQAFLEEFITANVRLEHPRPFEQNVLKLVLEKPDPRV